MILFSLMQWDRNWPYMVCPVCRKNIEDPNWRFKCLFSYRGLPCFHCGVRLKLVGRQWWGYGVGGALLLSGGWLWSTGTHVSFCFALLLAGIAVLSWGLLTSRLLPAETGAS